MASNPQVRLQNKNKTKADPRFATGETAYKLLQEYKIPPTPENFQLIYAFVQGENSALCKDVSQLLDSNRGISEGLITQAYDKHFRSGEEETLLHKTNIRLHGELEKVLANLRTAENDTHNFGNTLQGYSGSLEAETDRSSIKHLIDGLINEAQSMERKSRILENQLKDSSDEIDKLKRNLEAVRAETLTDALTGIGNRKQFDHALTELGWNAEHTNKPLSVIMGDVDHFKNFNDTWGHQLGDHVLKLVAFHLKTQIGDNGIPARYGGEEFAVVLPGTDLEQAVDIANRIRESVSRKAMKSKATGVTLGRITMSFGVSTYSPGENLNKLVARADSALYSAKKSGRNCVISEAALEDLESA